MFELHRAFSPTYPLCVSPGGYRTLVPPHRYRGGTHGMLFHPKTSPLSRAARARLLGGD